MNRNILYAIVAVLAVAVAVFGYQYYRDQQTSGIEMSIGDKGFSVEKK
ncbi:MAG: hypothetical protein HC900_04685 [Methylacidiphilales bacterium]|nr:hypothetical protein [Candidatus Methylacidiphilales bacterium]